MAGGVVCEVKFPCLVAGLSLIGGKLTLKLQRRPDFQSRISLAEQLLRPKLLTPLRIDRRRSIIFFAEKLQRVIDHDWSKLDGNRRARIRERRGNN